MRAPLALCAEKRPLRAALCRTPQAGEAAAAHRAPPVLGLGERGLQLRAPFLSPGSSLLCALEPRAWAVKVRRRLSHRKSHRQQVLLHLSGSAVLLLDSYNVLGRELCRKGGLVGQLVRAVVG